jgi:hypothetical protein
VKALLMKLLSRIGRRGAFLVFLTILDAAYGYSLLADAGAIKSIDLFLPVTAWGIIWLTVAAVCATGVFAKGDWPQYTIASLLKAVWGGLFVQVWLVQGLPRGWVSVVIWFAFALTVALVGGWPEKHAFAPDEKS